MSCTKNIIFFDFSSFLILTISKFCVFYVYKEVADLVKTIFFNNRIFQIIKCYYLYRSLGYFLLFRKQHLNNKLKIIVTSTKHLVEIRNTPPAK